MHIPKTGPPLLSRISLRTLVPLAMVLPLLIVVAALSVIVWVHGRTAAADLERQIFDQAGQRITQRLTEFVELPQQINSFNAHLIRSGVLDRSDVASWRNTLYEQVRAFRTVSSIGFASTTKDTTWIVNYPDQDTYEWGVLDDSTNRQMVEQLIAQESGENIPGSRVAFDYDPHVRPWYTAAIKNPGKQVWSDIYLWVTGRDGPPELGLGLVQTVEDDDGNLLGVHDTELSITQISTFLAELEVGENGSVYIVDQSLGMIATSTLAPLVEETGVQVNAAELEDPRAVAIAQHVLQTGLPSAPHTDLTLYADGEELRVRIIPFRHETGLEWSVWMALPTDTLLANSRHARNQMVSTGLLATVLVVLIGVILSIGAVRTLMQLADQVRAMDRGNFEVRPALRVTKELGTLSSTLNDFSHHLKERLHLKRSMDLAVEVQQNLLPETSPSVEGLDISTHSVFCDETGGDYYDFLPLTGSAQSSLTFTIGDVTGHGVGAALLMATARGVMRSRAIEDASLAKLLAHTNAMLFFDTRGVTFMTMLLISIDTETRTLRWASAGHPPPIVYSPATDRFTELQSGTLPLGVMEHAKYAEQEITRLDDGTVIVACTDGIWEAQNADGEAFGFERLRTLIREHAACSSDEISERILSALATHRDQSALDDDLTLVIVKVCS